MRVLVTGATGYIGGRLVPALVTAGVSVRCVARLPERLAGRFDGVEIVRGDVFDEASMIAAMDGIEVAYYLIHSMSGNRHDFTQSDRVAAERFGASSIWVASASSRRSSHAICAAGTRSAISCGRAAFR